MCQSASRNIVMEKLFLTKKTKRGKTDGDIGCDARLHPLAKVIVIVLVMAVSSGFQQAMSPY